MSQRPSHSTTKALRAIRWFVCGLLFAIGSQAFGKDAPVLEIGPGFRSLGIQSDLDILLDPGGKLRADQAVDHPGFERNTRGRNNLGFSSDPIWIRFRLAPAPGGPEELLLELAYPLLDEISLILIGPDGRSRFEAGDTRLPGDRALGDVNPVFPVHLSREGPVTGLLRIQTSGSLQFPLRLWTRGAYAADGRSVPFMYGLYYGVFLALTLLACAMFVSTRDPSFLLYCAYLLSYAALQFTLNGLVPQSFWSQGGLLSSRLPSILAATTMILLLLFVSRTLGFWSQSRVLRWLFRAFTTLSLVVLVLGMLGPLSLSGRIASVQGGILFVPVLAAGVFAWRRGLWVARYLVVAWGLFLLGVSVSSLTMLGLLPSGFFTTYAMQVGSTMEVCVLALALLDRVRTLREQKDAAMASARGYLRQLNGELEDLVARRTQKLEISNARLMDMASRDSLTGLLNHRSCIDGASALLNWAGRSQLPTAVIMLDIDHFKQVNDRFGHQRGDQILKLVADALMLHIRPRDVCGRYGGEEFLLAVTGIDKLGALRLADRLRATISSISSPDFDDWTLTASLGVAVVNPEVGITAEVVIGLADRALYDAKRNGRNRVEFAGNLGHLEDVVSFKP